MPLDEDKYPMESGRRRFVKGVVGSAALAGVGTGSAMAIGATTNSSGVGGGTTQAMAIENVDGPAPRGMPIIPLTIENGELKGVWPEVTESKEDGQTVKVAETDMGGVTYSTQWFQYCGVQTYPGTQPENDQDNFFRVGSNPAYDWMSDLSSGDKLTVDMFDDYEEWGNGIGQSGLGKPATGRWRSEDVDQTMPIQVIRSPRIEEQAQDDEFLSAATEQGFLAWLNKCTHFCCVPGFKQLEGSASFDAEDKVYCQCHQSVYNPFSAVQTPFVALPRPGE
ncbi:cytochrome B [Halobacteriales archaeon SW_8_65_20]|nr:MAG: cytochrome B [Halobacteriales archaeon SW_6_65_46]PSQ54033.1 MAG: cytochrome B [Halobacteriales archaeon SW_8_65_20]